MKIFKLVAVALLGMLLSSLPVEAATFKTVTYREHATDCTSLVDGKTGHYCWELDSSVIYKCIPSAGACDTAGEWIPDVPLTAIALAANGGNCSAGSYPLGVDTLGAVESCTDASTEIDSIVATHAGVSNAHHTATVEINNLETIATDIEINEILTGTASNTGVYKLLPDCNVAGSALAYENSTQDWSCRSGLGGGSFDSTTVDDTTWSDGANATNTWTFDVSGTNHTMTIGSALITFSHGVTISGALIAQSYGGITEANLLDKSSSEVITGDYDFGGGGLETENNTALPGACTVGQLFMDTDATSGQQLYGCEGGSFVLQGDGGGAEVNNLESDGAADIADTEFFIGTGAGTGNYVALSVGVTVTNAGVVTINEKFTWTMRPQQAKLDATAPMGIDGGNAKWRGTLDDTVTDEAATWETVLFPYQGGTLQGKIFYTLETTSSSDVAAFDLLIECKSDGDSSYTAFAPGTTNSIDSPSQSLTADVLDVLTDTSLNEDSCAEYDTMTVKLFRDVSADGVTDDIFITKVTIEEL